MTATATATERVSEPRKDVGVAESEPRQPLDRDAGGAVARILRYGFVTMLDDLAVSLVLGILVSGAIVAALPASVFDSPLASGLPALLLMLVVGVPLYVCALSSTPIAAALIAKGLSPGAAFVFLLAGPATNAATLILLARVLGKRVVLVQVAALALTVVALGWCVDRVYLGLGRSAVVPLGADVGHERDWLSVLAAIVLGTLLLVALIRVVRARWTSAAPVSA